MRFYKQFYDFVALRTVGKCTSRHLFRYGRLRAACSSLLLSQYVYLYYPLTKKQTAVINKGTVAHPLQGKVDSADQDLEPALNENASSEKLYL